MQVFRLWSLPRMRNLETLRRLMMSNATHQVMGLLDIQVTAILIARSPEADPEVNLKVGHLMGPAAPHHPGGRVHPEDRVHSGNRIPDGDRSRDKDHRFNHGLYYPEDHDRYCPNYDRYHDDRFCDFDSRYYNWGYDRRYDNRGGYWSFPHRFPPPLRPDDHCSVDLRDMHPWVDPSFRDRGDSSGSSDHKCNADDFDGHQCKSSCHDSRDHHRDRCSKSPSKPEHSQSCSPQHKE